MDLKSISAKELARHLMPLLKRNFLEWKRMKKEMFSKGRIKDLSRDEDKIEKIITSDAIAVFYAHWLKCPNGKENDQRLRDKMINYIKGSFLKELTDEKMIGMFYAKCSLIISIHHTTAPKIIEAALALRSIAGPERTTLKEIFENEKAFKIMVRSSMPVAEWRLAAAVSLGWVAQFEVDPKDLFKITRASHTVLSKRERELFS